MLARIRAGQVERLFSLGNFATPRHVDHACRSGLFHSLWFDLEHFDIPLDQLTVLNLVAQGFPMTSVARFKASDRQTVRNVLATGVGGVMAAMVETPDEAREIALWSNPERSAEAHPASGALWSVAPAAVAERVVICQIETPEAAAQVDAIAAVPGVDGLFFGPGDYAHRIGRLGQIAHPEVLAALEATAAACRRHGKFLGTVSLGRDHFRQVRDLGARLIGIGGDLRVLNLGLRELAKSFADD